MPNLVQVPFHGDTLWALQEGDRAWVAIKPICEALGIAWNKQLERIKRDAILSEGMTIMVIPSPGGAQETVCLPLELLDGFLFGIEDRRVSDPVTRERVITYKRECYRVLFEQLRKLPSDEAASEPLPFNVTSPEFREALSTVREVRLTYGRAAAAAVWRLVGLPLVPEMKTPALTPDLATLFAADPVAQAIPDFVTACCDDHGWAGTATDLLAVLDAHAPQDLRVHPMWPRTAQSLGNRLDRIAPVLRSRGVQVRRKHSGIRTIHLIPLDTAARAGATVQ